VIVARAVKAVSAAECETLEQLPNVLDTFMSATDFMAGAAPAPWWHYTAQRKALFGPV
jgi:hypothetical protein